MTTAYPLAWPDGWPRTPPSDRGYISSSYNRPAQEKTVLRLLTEIDRLKATHVVLSTNLPIRRDGLPYAAERRIEDPGAAVYFVRAGRQLVMAQDRYCVIDENIRSLALAIEGMRQMERHGGAVMMDRAFAGFETLPSPEVPERPWFEVLGVAPDSPREVIEAAYRALAKQQHPDLGGTERGMSELNKAREQAMKERT